MTRTRHILTAAITITILAAITATAAYILPGAVFAALGSLILGAWAWIRTVTRNEARGGHIYVRDRRTMLDSWKP